ncbi:tetratricopeptide repeat protein [Bradyrhizobium sp.]|uniref:CHAT domain-containing tetratricopeptide repeat protein n=1 Tax=Bradyrhizobium sp. TaxID=376 RepID=UPI0027331584|nr:tetratricopeptide repeat protein [Bradyrhizobium sp.]MDP3075009.1 tetratricopeptide repeat protein [Bradyrhizobium sp.]
MSNLPRVAVRAIMSRKVFVRFACIALVAAMVQVPLISPPLAQTAPPQTVIEVQILNKQVNELAKAGKYTEAIPLQQRALAIQEKALGPDHPGVAGLLYNLAYLYHVSRRYADAEPLYKRSLALEEKALGYDHPNIAGSLNNLAILYRDQGRYAEAEPPYRRALAIREKALGPDHPDVATSLNNLANLFEDQGRYADTEPLYKRSLAIREKALGPDHPDVAASLNNLAILYRDQGRYADAEPLYRRSLAIQEKVLGPNHPDVATALNNLANLHGDRGQHADAEPLYKRSLAIREKALGPDHPDVASSLNNLANFYRVQGRYADAEPLFKRSLATGEKALGPDHPEVAAALNNLAILYRVQGRHADAEPLYRRSLAIKEKALGPDHPDVADSLNNLANLDRDQGRYADAEPRFKRALAIWAKSFGPDHPGVAMALNNLAVLNRRQGRYSDAEPLYKRGLAILEKSLGPDHPDVADLLNDLALLYYAQRRYAQALPLVRRTIARGRASKAVTFPVLFQAKRQNLVNVASAFDDSYDTVQRASSSAAANAVSKLAARFAAGAGPLADLVREDQDLTAEAERLDKGLIAAISKPPAERNAAADDQIRKRIDAIESKRDKLKEIFNQRFPDYVALSKPQPLSLKQTQALLADDEALVVLDFDATSYAWIVTRTDADWVELQVSAKDIDSQVRALRQSLTFAGNKPFDPQLAFKIYRETFGAFADRIAAKKRLSVVSNGALTSLPPALLVTKEPGGKELKDVDWLIRSHAVTILPSVSSLKILRTASATTSAAKPMIAFGDPVFSRTARAQALRQVAMRSITAFYSGTKIDIASLRERLPQLPGTRTEVQAIAKALHADPGDIRLGLAVTETAAKQARLDQYRIIYFATHGLVAGELAQFTESKAEPALALSIPDRATDLDDGLLSASEIAQLKLNADWVVLSACNTAAEDKPGAEALSGLARAFFYAGARSLIVSHWEVADEATARLMTGTFQASASDTKLSHGEALRQSMLALIDNANTDDDAHPRLWAPFVVVGEPAKPR